ncbi:MAG: bifunctional tetrahydrofolate synthase/dihydrofolate synthase [Halomonas sp.]|nr:bifunctional tetrahydrofolate synthase/dihydrofolate synthase [Halomonas sp.]MDN6296415.1 bifunctional tetrahydrofolate synthase/dihydrofolate synthase [Halomonas sp.]MDN6313768.1 bifunctional tetrahydrofolate synthase/dihydrofolate synthase [Halomonas sp.]MDN6335222.1 bifunctional tetrahydrofolate synthase/dihydrofolate synthase [Halomonas sp.]
MPEVTADHLPDTLSAWLDYWERLHPVGIDMGLERVRAVAERMELVHEGGLQGAHSPPQVITVAGTNGKGSTVALLASLARAHGKRVGCYTSPHLVRYNERVTIDGEPASDALLVAGFARVEKARRAAPDISLTYFEAGTLCALWCLAQSALDVVVLEVGLGGRLDAVNIIDADVAIVTTIAQDHAGFLGNDIAQIGREKAGIFRAERPAVLGSQALPSSVAETAKAVQAPVYALDEAFSRTPAERGKWAFQCESAPALTALPDPGLPLDNAATALQALVLAGVELKPQAVVAALEQVSLPGRMQWHGQWCLDVGHNPHAAAYVAERFKGLPEGGRRWCLLGMLDDKDAAGVIAALRPVISDWVCVSLDGPRARCADALAQDVVAQGGWVHHCAASPEAGAEWLGSQLNNDDIVLVAGSFFTVGALLATPRFASGA